MKNVEPIISSFLKYLSIIVLLQNSGVVATVCKTMSLLPEKSGSYLRNHAIRTLTVSSQSMCRITCYLSDKQCLSYNFHQSSGTCEINDSDEFQHPEDLIPSHGHVYRGTKVTK
ncbi:uncharacterized protein LOC116304216 [Actinia tenebrosa]|uniref:Uncharacterized protein LOC116304216 n=1 Tax=Actinia tenebrosa TaxID=6105 RepID=A0A6P8IU91_ACTTE|nr:uncharacterized protein LOC116304216 [Actinia tenebrosa]